MAGTAGPKSTCPARRLCSACVMLDMLTYSISTPLGL
ncbi:Uncharacterised protein [Mycobacterium tuberculosis]|nr:Uncharacterised protein [Mycobacterium tuberculosis]